MCLLARQMHVILLQITWKYCFSFQINVLLIFLQTRNLNFSTFLDSYIQIFIYALSVRVFCGKRKKNLVNVLKQ